MRLLANLLDGLVAVEHGRKQATGDLWNEVPDRIADVALFLGAGYGLAGLGATIGGEALGPLLGWSAAALALATAYVRQLGGALGLAQDFRGPMAKQQRMFVLTLGVLTCAVDATAPLARWNPARRRARRDRPGRRRHLRPPARRHRARASRPRRIGLRPA